MQPKIWACIAVFKEKKSKSNVRDGQLFHIPMLTMTHFRPFMK